MHIPDNYLSPSTCAVFGAAMIPVWKKSVTKVKEELTPKKIPMLGVCSAFSFLIMMFNVPLPGGTTGHAVGAALSAILIGPFASVISITMALVVQALFFGDGGILALGANCFNMAFVMPFVAYYVYNFIKNKFKNKQSDYIAVVIASYVSLNAAALLAAIEFGIQPALFKSASGVPLYCPYGLNVSIPAMLIPHLLVAGVIEALVTLGVYYYIKKASPETIYEGSYKTPKAITRLLILMVVLSPIGLLANGTAWGEWGTDEIKEVVGFIPQGIEKGINFNALMPDYSVASLPEYVGYILSALAGIAIIIITFKIIGTRKQNKKVNAAQ